MLGAECIERGIRVGLIDCGLGGVEADDVRTSTFQGCKAESAGVTERIEDAPPTGHLHEQTTVVALVEEESGLLSSYRIYLIPEAVLLKLVGKDHFC